MQTESTLKMLQIVKMLLLLDPCAKRMRTKEKERERETVRECVVSAPGEKMHFTHEQEETKKTVKKLQ